MMTTQFSCSMCVLLREVRTLDTVYKGVNFETSALLEHWGFCAKNVDKTCDFLGWLIITPHCTCYIVHLIHHYFNHNHKT